MANKKINKKQNKKIVKNNKNNRSNDDEHFSFENEIIIGITKQDKQTANNIKNQKKSKKQKTNKNKVYKKSNLNKTVKDNNYMYSNNLEEKQNSKVKREKRVKIIKCGLILLGIVTVVLCTLFSPLFNIKRIKVEGNKKISEREIISLSQIKLNENMFKLNKGKISKQIKENAYINSVKIERNLPDEICIKIEEREVAYLLEYVESYLYIDKQGYIIEISPTKQDVPILQGTSTLETKFKQGNRLDKEDLEKLLALDKVIESAKVNEIAALITRIDINNINNIKLIFETEDKVAYIGDINNLVTKIPTIKKILEKENGISGEIFVNMDLNKENAIFRERV